MANVLNDLFFSLISSEGRKFSLKDLLESYKFVVLFFYPKDDTPKCRIEVVDFSDLVNEFKKYNAFVLGISRDSINSHRNFQTKYNLKIELLSDVNSVVCHKFSVLKKKKMFGKEYFGISRSTFILSNVNANADIVYQEMDVNVDGHAKNILQKIIELSNGLENI